MSSELNNKRIKVDTQRLELSFSYGARVSLVNMKTSVRRTKKMFHNMTRDYEGMIKYFVPIMKNKTLIARRPRVITIERYRDLFISAANDSIQLLRTLGCPLGAELSLQNSQEISAAMDKVREHRYVIITELVKPLPEYGAIADEIIHLLRLVLDVVILVSSILNANIQNFKTK
jgi:hypothetical protein